MDNTNNISFDRLRYFVRAAELEHVGQAARSLHVTPSVVSAAIRVLEQEYDRSFFKRERQRIRLTEDGRKFQRLAEELLAAAAGLRARLGNPETALTGNYRIGASHFLMVHSVVPALQKLVDNNPGVSFELTSLDTASALARVQAGQLDCAVVFRSSYKEKLREDILWSGDFQIVTIAQHPVHRLSGAKRLLRLRELPPITFRTTSGGDFWELHPALTGLGLNPRGEFFYDDTETAIRLLQLTSGWAFLPEVIAASDPRLKALKLPTPPKAPVNVSLVSGMDPRSQGLRAILSPGLSATFPGRS